MSASGAPSWADDHCQTISPGPPPATFTGFVNVGRSGWSAAAGVNRNAIDPVGSAPIGVPTSDVSSGKMTTAYSLGVANAALFVMIAWNDPSKYFTVVPPPNGVVWMPVMGSVRSVSYTHL